MDAAHGGAAVAWWIGVVALFVVVIPLAAFLAQRVLRHVGEIQAYADDVLAHGLSITNNLDAVSELVETRALVKRVGAGLGDYAASLDRLL